MVVCGTSSHVVGFQYVSWGDVEGDEMGFERDTIEMCCVVCSIFSKEKK